MVVKASLKADPESWCGKNTKPSRLTRETVDLGVLNPAADPSSTFGSGCSLR